VNFAHPAWLILLVLLPLLGAGAIAVARLRRKQWSVFVASRLRSAILRRGSPLPRWFALIFLLAACATIIGALARPQGDAGTRTEKSLGRNLLIALDLSRSMRVADVKPDRLAQAKMVIFEMLEAMPNERIGLIGFAGSAYSFAPLTVDHAAVRETVEQIDENWTTQGGSDLGAAISLAIDTLRKTGQKNNALVILSDGEQHDGSLSDIIEQANQSGVFILAIGVGTEDGDYVPFSEFPGGKMLDRSGNPVISRLQTDVLRRLATETNGRYAVAGAGVDVPGMVKSFIKDLDAFEMEGRERRVSVEFYQWLLLPAILFLMCSLLAGTRWRGVNRVAAAAVVFLLPCFPARADEVSEARRALEENRHGDAKKAYRKLAEASPLASRKARFRLGEAAAAYQGGEFRDARAAYSEALLSKDPALLESAHLGLGVTLFQLGWMTLSGEAYPADPADAPTLESFDALVRGRFDQILQPHPADDESSNRSKPIESIIVSWTDAVRHFDTVLSSGHSSQSSPDKTSARNNRTVTITYLKRLQELLEEEIQQTEDAMPQPGEGEGEPGQPGEGDPDEPQEGDSDEEGPGSPKSEEGEGEGDEPQEPQEDSDGEEDSDQDQGKKPGEQEEEGESGKTPADPNESPEDRARRLLKESADLEKGPLTPGRREFRDPDKDW
jgi:Ca-activated chloride channel family protein